MIKLTILSSQKAWHALVAIRNCGLLVYVFIIYRPTACRSLSNVKQLSISTIFFLCWYRHSNNGLAVTIDADKQLFINTWKNTMLI